MYTGIRSHTFILNAALVTHDKLKHIGHLLLTLCLVSVVHAQATSIKTYRGSLGDKHIEMRLTVNGSKLTGTYFYDRFKQEIPLDGAYDAKGQLELVEGSGKRKTGKFICKNEPETPGVDLDCEWSQPDGTGKAFVFLNEQGVLFKNDISIKPKVINDRQRKVDVSYPQLSAPVITPAMAELNRLIESRVNKAIKEFEPESYSNAYFDTTYNVLFADDEKVSLELNEDSYAGGAHPSESFWTVNYDLKANRELTLEDVFKPGDEYKTTIAEFVAKDINRRAEEIEKIEARANNRPPEKREEPVMTGDQLPDMNTWGFTTKGFVAYFDFPHVMAVFDKTVVPYSIVVRYVKPNGVVPIVR
ncbi:MAG TPA: DUF3298 and DUF4163 domain-containing protein [Pyrinomonadaceae bacterium]|nr:DUF3298 and DUF4163 domain-containing protein [Pyrinomonadaceae bacterium]